MSESIRHVVREIYSEVLFELAEEADQVKQVMDDLERVVGVIHDNHEFAALLNSQQLNGTEKSEIVQRIFESRVNNLTLDFLRVLARRGRLAFLAGISDKYEVMVDAHHKRSLIEVTLAKSPDDDELEQIKESLKDAVNSDVKLVVNIDPEIIGGVIIKKGDKLVDNSLRRILNRAVKTIVQRSRN